MLFLLDEIDMNIPVGTSRPALLEKISASIMCLFKFRQAADARLSRERDSDADEDRIWAPRRVGVTVASRAPGKPLAGPQVEARASALGSA